MLRPAQHRHNVDYHVLMHILHKIILLINFLGLSLLGFLVVGIGGVTLISCMGIGPPYVRAGCEEESGTCCSS